MYPTAAPLLCQQGMGWGRGKWVHSPGLPLNDDQSRYLSGYLVIHHHVIHK